MLAEIADMNIRNTEKFIKKRSGTPILTATELGFACPICGADEDDEDGICGFMFSEFVGFMWCKRCNDVRTLIFQGFSARMLNPSWWEASDYLREKE